MNDVILQERVTVTGACGPLAGELAYPPGEANYACLLAGPHPYMGGHQDNNVLRAVAHRLPLGGAVTLRFDYGGVGDSIGPRIDVAAAMAQFWQTGVAPQDPTMVEDARSAGLWLLEQTRLPLAVVGYSFGAYAATAGLADVVRAMVLISPTLRQHDFSGLNRRVLPKLVLYSDNDFATPAERVRDWLANLSEPWTAHCISGAEHFFRGREDEAASHCEAFLAAAIESDGRYCNDPCCCTTRDRGQGL